MNRSASALTAAFTAVFLSTTASAQGAWTRLSPAVEPSLRGGMSLSSDGSSLLMFGGQTSGTVFLDELWRFDGTNWTNITPTTGSPAPRDWHGQAFDLGRGKLIVFGGRDQGGPMSDTWEFDGTTWTQLSPITVPPARFSPAICYDIVRGRIVMFGGAAGSMTLNDTWEWDGTNWNQITTANSPLPRQKHRMVFDLRRNLTVMHGGNLGAGQGRSTETWTYDGTDWTVVAGAAAPFGTGLENYGMAYDLVRGRSIINGGLNTSYRSKTWDWDGSNWLDRGNFLSTGLTARTGQAMEYLQSTGKVYQFGGFAASTFVSETYEWSTPTVAQFQTVGTGCPSSRGLPVLATTTAPWGGDPFTLTVANLGSNMLSFMLIGLSNTQWAGGSLPQSLAILGAPSCTLDTSIDIGLPGLVQFGEARYTLTIPDDPALYGATIYAQGLCYEGFTLFTTARGDITIGGY